MRNAVEKERQTFMFGSIFSEGARVSPPCDRPQTARESMHAACGRPQAQRSRLPIAMSGNDLLDGIQAA